jgi:DNA polymerase-3 subunit beta
VTTDSYKARIQGVSDSEFPIIPKIDSKDHNLEINSSTLKEALSEVISAAHVSEIHPEISGVLLDFQVSVVKFVATDSFRLAERTLPQSLWKSTSSEGWKVIIPLKTAQEIVRIFPNDSILHILADANQLFVKTEQRELISRVIEGNYPDYEQIIPKSIETEVVVSREKFANALRLVSSFSGKTNDIKLRLHESSKALEVYSSNQAVGENTYLIPAKSKGPAFSDVVFNWRYLLDGLKPQTSENLFIGVNGDHRPALLKSPEESFYFYIVMPLKNS